MTGPLVVGRRAAAGREPVRRILLIGHYDTVFEPDSPFQDFKTAPSGQATGPGVADMKGGNVAIIYVGAFLLWN